MSDVPPIWILLTTYKRREIALRTIRGVKDNLLWPNIGWVITDDGSGEDHLQVLRDEIGGSYAIETYDGQRRGVGHNMNWGLRRIWEMGADLTLVLEDDWYLEKPLDMTPYVNLLMNNADIGMIRLGYLSYNLLSTIIKQEDKLWLKFLQNGNQYVYAGHASLRHKRLHQAVGMFTEGLAPGANELDFCGRYNHRHSVGAAPDIVWPLEFGWLGPFSHIGSESLADIQPEG